MTDSYTWPGDALASLRKERAVTWIQTSDHCSAIANSANLLDDELDNIRCDSPDASPEKARELIRDIRRSLRAIESAILNDSLTKAKIARNL